MKRILHYALSCLMLFAVQAIQAQTFPGNSYGIPFKSHESVMFGKDIEIYNLDHQNQNNLTICSAQNGWLYAAYSFDSIGYQWFSIMRSENNGYTWTSKLCQQLAGPQFRIKKMTLLITGETTLDQKLIFGVVIKDLYSNYYELDVNRYNCDPFQFINSPITIYSPSIADLSICSDDRYTPPNSYPKSIGLLYSKSETHGSIIFTSSTDGGFTFGNNKVVAQTTKKFHKVSLSFGRSSSQNSGGYFATWEEQDDSTSNLGHIYTSHSGNNLTNAFSTPMQLDTIDPSLTNLCRNPVISCQVNDTDNDSANISEVVLFEKFNSGSGDYDITGFYNKKAATGNTFTRLDISATSHNELQPDITFNEFDSSFAVTYYDSATQKLPLLKKDLNLASPGNWEVVTPGYNETYDLADPNPKVRVNMTEKKVMNGWVGKRNNGNGVALFDAPYMPSTSIPEQGVPEPILSLKISPNPCSTSFTVSFETTSDEQVSGELFNLLGKPATTITRQPFRPGTHSITCHVDNLPAGTYFYRLTAGHFSKTIKIVVIR